MAQPLEAQLGGSSRRETAVILHEGLAEKESKYLGRWRPRWLVLFRDHTTQLPALCTFKTCRAEWDPHQAPNATERIWLVGASCITFPDSEFHGGRINVFHLQARSGDFFFSAPTAAESADWARAISQSIAEAALRLGGSFGSPSASPSSSLPRRDEGGPGDAPFTFGSPELSSPASIDSLRRASGASFTSATSGSSSVGKPVRTPAVGEAASSPVAHATPPPAAAHAIDHTAEAEAVVDGANGSVGGGLHGRSHGGGSGGLTCAATAGGGIDSATLQSPTASRAQLALSAAVFAASVPARGMASSPERGRRGVTWAASTTDATLPSPHGAVASTAAGSSIPPAAAPSPHPPAAVPGPTPSDGCEGSSAVASSVRGTLLTEEGGVAAQPSHAVEGSALERAALERAALEGAALERAALERAALEGAARVEGKADVLRREKEALEAQLSALQSQLAAQPPPPPPPPHAASHEAGVRDAEVLAASVATAAVRAAISAAEACDGAASCEVGAPSAAETELAAQNEVLTEQVTRLQIKLEEFALVELEARALPAASHALPAASHALASAMRRCACMRSFAVPPSAPPPPPFPLDPPPRNLALSI